MTRAAKARPDPARDRAIREQEEAKAEQLAPHIQRVPVRDDAGVVLRGPRTVVRHGRAEVANVVRLLAVRQAKRAGATPLITEEHVEAAEHFLVTYREVAAGVGRASNLELLPGRHGPPGDGAHQEILHQLAMREELRRALECLGPLAAILVAIVVEGRPIASLSRQHGVNRSLLSGWLAASLTLLVAHYRRRD